ncbi:MAG: L7Ae/L30e/S12e/Gadd45 family ribosomal protein [Thermanaeromonas sp.]|uniref:L7Ae/L30e/S12e/Gadd45 family ribosomal protein n=1 Tax=Thermanaeromonas sp. TaxID=2003697 RepID=UPI002437C739|nr:L7Ae/L30e/S12e/Gadd45 family ribosomal protein [Thermanaeromonas sp.]MCG0277261.1 L7Ae/L30e/S12e/Gadd45 family ribosomal protein [Thermanaeromonas sp.]
MNQRVRELFGLALRARKLAWGARAVKAALSKGEVHFVWIARDASPRLKEDLLRACRRAGIEVAIGGTKEELGEALGKEPCAVIGLRDGGFADLIQQALKGVDGKLLR